MSDVATHLLSGTVAGMSSVLFDYPLDTLKTTMQASSASCSPSTSRPTSYLHHIQHCYGRGGVRSFYSGASLPLLAQGIENAVIFSVYRTVSVRLESTAVGSSPTTPPWRSPPKLIAAAAAGAAVSFVLTPVEYLKCNMQAGRRKLRCGGHCTSVPKLVLDTYHLHGLRGFYRGHSGTLLRAVPGNVAYFISYEQMKLWLGAGGPDGGWWSSVGLTLAGGLSGCAYWSICFPADVVKTRMQVDPSWSSYRFTEAVSRQYKGEGLRGMYRGWRVTAIRSFVSSAVVFSVYEWCTSLSCKAI